MMVLRVVCRLRIVRRLVLWVRCGGYLRVGVTPVLLMCSWIRLRGGLRKFFRFFSPFVNPWLRGRRDCPILVLCCVSYGMLWAQSNGRVEVL